LYCTNGDFFGSNPSRMTSVKEGWEVEICDLIPRCTEAFTWVEVETSLDASNLLNMLPVASPPASCLDRDMLYLRAEDGVGCVVC
jgi:hypothetical protein